jgi:hypothetical protein
MPLLVLTDASVSINTQALGSYVTSVTLNYEKDAIEVTAMGATGHVFDGGLENLSVTLEMQQDEAATKTLETLFAATGSGNNTLVLKNTSTGATFTCTKMYLQSSQPVTGSVGELSTQSVTFTGGTLVKT